MSYAVAHCQIDNISFLFFFLEIVTLLFSNKTSPILSPSSLWDGNTEAKSTYLSPQIRDLCFSFTLNPMVWNFLTKELIRCNSLEYL
jgi:hypothetical protein